MSDEEMYDLSEIFSYIEEGYRISTHTYKKKSKKGYIYLVSQDGLQKETFTFDVPEKIFKKIVSAVKKKIQEAGGNVFVPSQYDDEEQEEEATEEEQEEEEPEETEKPRKNKKKEQKTPLRLTKTIGFVDERTAGELAILSRTQSWFAEIIAELGRTTLFMILQMADVPAGEWYDKIYEFKKDPEGFLRWADRYIVALFEAKQDAKKMLEMRSEMAMLIAQNEALKFALKNREEMIKDLIERLNALTSMLSKNQIQKYLIWDALRQQVKKQKDMKIGLVNKEEGGRK